MFRENASLGCVRLLQSPNSTRLLRNCWFMGNWRARNDIVLRVFHSHGWESFENRLSWRKIDNTGEWEYCVLCLFFRRGVLVRSTFGIPFDSGALVGFSERTQNLLLYSRECFVRSRAINWLRRGRLRRFWFAETSTLATKGRFCRRFPLGVSSQFRS